MREVVGSTPYEDYRHDNTYTRQIDSGDKIGDAVQTEITS